MLTANQIRQEFPDFRGDVDHLRRLLEGVEAWNDWRSEAGDETPDLRGLHLERRAEPSPGELWVRGSDDSSLFVANLQQANLQGADLEEAHLEGAYLPAARLEDANLLLAHLQGANLMVANLMGANLQQANLQGANLGAAHLEDANLIGAHLERANLMRANLRKASLPLAHLRGSCLQQADLSEADLRVAKPRHLCLDDTRILGCRFAPGSRDPWSVVRRSYAGPVLLFHLLFLLVFLVPYLGRATYWKGVNAAQEAGAALQQAAGRRVADSTAVLEDLANDPTARESLETLLQAQGLDIDRSRKVLEEAVRRQRDRALASATLKSLQPAQKLGLCLQYQGDCASPQPIWRLLLGLHRQDTHVLLRFLGLALILYNVFRGGLTYYVSGLRDAEVRGGYSPRLREYIWVYYLHAWFLQYVPVAGLTAAVIQIAEWLLVTDVVLPAV